MEAIDKPGYFYLGKRVDDKSLELYDAKDLTTHAVCIGMTGSGKTGLGIALLEEAGLQGIPAIIIDPKGDLADLMLTFPDLDAASFKPWVEVGNADDVAKTWKEGLAAWGEGPERVKRLKERVDMAIYTPASTMGQPLSIINSFKAPPEGDQEEIQNKIQSLTSSLLGLLGISADPLKSREHILISNILDQAWKNKQDLDIPGIINQIQKPPFTKIGALDIETFYPTKERMELSIRLNNLLAAPGFQVWMEGEPLDIQALLQSEAKKPKLSIISIAHLADSERMFFVTLLLNQLISWMRQQPGTSNLRAILYMDEIFGYFPPSAMPPSKLPMLTLLKQARAYGVGIVLVTQNPVDLDYKGLSNCGTWFIGKLQTDRDKKRVVEGLSGAIDAKFLDKTGNRCFIKRSVHDDKPSLFQTRWTLSYLKGPLTLNQIATLCPNKPQIKPKSTPKPQKPTVHLTEYFTSAKQYTPWLFIRAKTHYVDAKNKIDEWQSTTYTVSASTSPTAIDWSTVQPESATTLTNTPQPDSSFQDVPSWLMQDKNIEAFKKAFILALYQNETFKGSVAADAIKQKYQAKIAAIQEKMKRAESKVQEKQQKSWTSKLQTAISFGTTILGAFMGRGGITKGTVSQAGTSLRRASQMTKESQDASNAEESYNDLEQQLKLLQTQMDSEIQNSSLTLRPKKGDIAIIEVALLWREGP